METNRRSSLTLVLILFGMGLGTALAETATVAATGAGDETVISPVDATVETTVAVPTPPSIEQSKTEDGTRMASVTPLPIAVMASAAAAPAPPSAAPAVQIHGFMQNRIYAAPGSNLQFRSERIAVQTIAALPNESTGYVELYYHPWAPSSGLYLESAFYETGLGDGRIRVGKGRRITFGITPAYPNRRTSNYGLVSETFTQDRTQGIQYTLRKGVLDAAAGIHTGYRLGIRNLGEVPGDSIRNASHQVPHLSYRDPVGGGGAPDSRLNSKLEFSGRFGGRWKNGLSAGASVSFGGLDDRDLVNLTTSNATNVLTPGGTPALLPEGANGDRRVLGLDFTYKQPKGFLAQGEWYTASLSDLDLDAMNLLIGWEPPQGWKFFARYSRKDMDVARTANPLTWDTQQISISAVQPLRKGLWIQYEYEKNQESPVAGFSKVSNDLFFVELFSGF